LQGFASTSAGASADSAWSRSGKGNVIMQMMQVCFIKFKLFMEMKK
jgi:hypothetical protein